MISDFDTETLTLHNALVEELTAKLNAAISDRDDTIRTLLAKGAGATELSRAVALSRERIYQIKRMQVHGRRNYSQNGCLDITLRESIMHGPSTPD